jgi:hypothetical protein
MRYDEQPRNGHHHPSWDLFGILLGIQGTVSRVEAALERTHEVATTGLDRANERIDTLHERIDTHLATPKTEKRGWISSTGLETKEFVGLVLMALTGLGMLSPELVKLWLGH